ncbi:agouti signaling protein 1 [Parambassis ranga]|uniref:Agouti-signaling protein n=1 Tax=Parambassis ranga TaxID=210632 RepID=A0A6P7I2Y2_9TELE|nr:agouti-signaling protein-like [Parambassis ranga]
MHTSLLLGCFILAVTEYFLVPAHMIPDERLSTNRVVVSNALSQNLEMVSPPVVIVELPKTAKKNKKTKKQKNNKFGVKRRPPPPPGCIPQWGSCKSPENVCCDYCAFCQCRLFRTVCFCRMGNARC